MTEHTHTTSRRQLLNAAPAAMVLAGAGIGGAVAVHATASQPGGTPPHPDAELIALCARYVALDREFCAVGRHAWDMLCSDPEYIRCSEIERAMVPELHALEDEIGDTPARTLLGLQAKAQVARRQLSGDADQDTGPMDPSNDLVWSLVLETLDVLGSAGA